MQQQPNADGDGGLWRGMGNFNAIAVFACATFPRQSEDTQLSGQTLFTHFVYFCDAGLLTFGDRSGPSTGSKSDHETRH